MQAKQLAPLVVWGVGGREDHKDGMREERVPFEKQSHDRSIQTFGIDGLTDRSLRKNV
jgi:hypothetical protein